MSYSPVDMVSTPILDLKQAPPEPAATSWVSVLIAGLAGLLLGLTPILKFHYLPHLNGFLLLPALYVAIAIHEAGHLFFGRIVGMPPGALVIGGIVIFRSGQRWLIRFDYRRIFGGGLSKVLPSKTDFRPSAFAWMVAGGPIASLLFTLAFGLAAFKYGDGQWKWLGSLAWVGLLTTVVSLIPASSGLNKSDGTRLLVLMKRPDESRSWIALYAVQTEDTRGVVPREWDPELVMQMLLSRSSSSEYPYIQLLAFYRCMNLNNDEEALEHLEKALASSARCGKILRQCLFLEAAACSAHQRDNANQARTWLERACALGKPKSTDGVEAAIAICEKRYDDALRHLATSSARLEQLKLDSGLARFSKEKLAEYERLCSGASSALSMSDG